MAKQWWADLKEACLTWHLSRDKCWSKTSRGCSQTLCSWGKSPTDKNIEYPWESKYLRNPYMWISSSQIASRRCLPRLKLWAELPIRASTSITSTVVQLSGAGMPLANYHSSFLRYSMSSIWYLQCLKRDRFSLLLRGDKLLCRSRRPKKKPSSSQHSEISKRELKHKWTPQRSRTCLQLKMIPCSRIWWFVSRKSRIFRKL